MTDLPAQRPPYDADIEAALVGSVLYYADAAFAAADGLRAEDLYVQIHNHIWDAATTLRRAGRHVDQLTVAEELTSRGVTVPEHGWLVALADLCAAGAPIAAVPTYSAKVMEFAQARRLIALAGELKTAAYAVDVDAATRLLNDQARTLIARAAPSLAWEDVTPAVRGDMPAITPTLLRRTDGAALLYPGLSHSIAGEPGKGKTWLALIAAAQTLEAGGRVVMLDYEGTPLIVGGRLRSLSVNPDAVAERFSYLRPGPVGPAETAALSRYAAETHPDLVIIDGVAKAVARQGGDEDRASDVLGWIEAVAHPFGCNGTAVVMLDHVVKAKDGRGRWARGSGAKLGEIEGAAYTVETVEAFSRTRPGRVNIHIAKDREGVVGSEGELAAVVRFAPAADDRLNVSVDPPSGVATDCEAAILAVVAELREVNESRLLDSLRVKDFHFKNVTAINTAETLASQGRIGLKRRGKEKLYFVTNPGDDF